MASPRPTPPREPTPRQQARWDAVQVAYRRGFSLRRIARALGISRTTVRKYLDAHSPPPYPHRPLPETNLRTEAVLTESLNS